MITGLLTISLFCLATCVASFDDIIPANGFLRRLIGSNCVLIERGNIPPYYDCVGCIIEEAAACVRDMRSNKSYNVASKCELDVLKEYYDHNCCPEFYKNRYGVTDLSYSGAAYPEGLRCLEKQGCAGSIIYSQLESECLRSCPFVDSRNGKSVCYSNFNSAYSVKASALLVVLSILVCGLHLFT